jgi:predicted DCC family thiol-disulfide oxidoreductase YuxK
MDQDHQHPIVFFDGVCGLCNRFVQFLFVIDQRCLFKVTPLQGAYAKHHLSENLRENLTSLVVATTDGRILLKSRAILYVFHQLGGMWRLIYLLGFWIPTAILDHLYDNIAAHRYQWFGKLDTCRIPKPEERQRFLD